VTALAVNSCADINLLTYLILTELSLCYSIMYYYNGAQCYEQFLQVGLLDQASILLDYSSLAFKHRCIFMLLYILNFFVKLFTFTKLRLEGLFLDLVD